MSVDEDNLLFLRKMEKRAYKRLATKSHCDIKCAVGHKQKIKNISIGGICLETSRHIGPNSIYDMKIVTKGYEEEHLKGEVVWSYLTKSLKDNGDLYPIYNIGFKFIGQNDKKNKFLQTLTKRLAHFDINS